MPKIGQTNERGAAVYRFSSHPDGSTGCHPTSDEKEIPLAAGERFPAMRSCGKAANLTFVREA
ncbi:MAG TPA: hypothetical protein VN239_06785 [Nitrososphaera sp.]|jgi:hypothetical protein|nr:hypothetical protein [Nitrososphaera sp.]